MPRKGIRALCSAPAQATTLFAHLHRTRISGHLQIAHAFDRMALLRARNHDRAFPILAELLLRKICVQRTIQAEQRHTDRPLDRIPAMALGTGPGPAGPEREIATGQMALAALCVYACPGRIRLKRAVLAPEPAQH